jgi:Protein phosphatase 2C
LPSGPPSARVGPADVELSTASLGTMDIRAASSRGLEHRATGIVRQDAFALASRTRSGEPEWLVAVVCDGVGSLPRSDQAAALASRRLAGLGVAGVPWPAAFLQVNAELTKAATELERDEGLAAGGMATTAVALVVHREGEEWVGDVAWIGDSALWHLAHDSGWTPVTCPPDEDVGSGYYSSVVAALPARNGTPAARPVRLRGGALFVMSDGVANPLRWSTDVRGTLARWWAVPPDPFTFAAQVGFARKTHADDRTVVGIWPGGGEIRAAEV